MVPGLGRGGWWAPARRAACAPCQPVKVGAEGVTFPSLESGFCHPHPGPLGEGRRDSPRGKVGKVSVAELHCLFFFNDTATTEIYTGEDTLSLHDALPI